MESFAHVYLFALVVCRANVSLEDTDIRKERRMAALEALAHRYSPLKSSKPIPKSSQTLGAPRASTSTPLFDLEIDEEETDVLAAVQRADDEDDDLQRALQLSKEDTDADIWELKEDFAEKKRETDEDEEMEAVPLEIATGPHQTSLPAFQPQVLEPISQSSEGDMEEVPLPLPIGHNPVAPISENDSSSVIYSSPPPNPPMRPLSPLSIARKFSGLISLPHDSPRTPGVQRRSVSGPSSKPTPLSRSKSASFNMNRRVSDPLRTPRALQTPKGKEAEDDQGSPLKAGQVASVRKVSIPSSRSSYATKPVLLDNQLPNPTPSRLPSKLPMAEPPSAGKQEDNDEEFELDDEFELQDMFKQSPPPNASSQPIFFPSGQAVSHSRYIGFSALSKPPPVLIDMSVPQVISNKSPATLTSPALTSPNSTPVKLPIDHPSEDGVHWSPSPPPSARPVSPPKTYEERELSWSLSPRPTPQTAPALPPSNRSNNQEDIEMSMSPPASIREVPEADRSFSNPPSDLEDDNEVDMNAEEDDYARFLAQVKGKDLREVQEDLDQEIKVLNAQRKKLTREGDENITQQMTSQIQVSLPFFWYNRLLLITYIGSLAYRLGSA